VDTWKLRNGVALPALGFGTFKIPDGQPVQAAVRTALQEGYTLIDTAEFYGNEKGIARAIREAGVKRQDLFLTSKVWNANHGYENSLEAFQRSLENLGTDYLDLYLIHWPKHENVATWKAMETLYREGRVRAIGVSNFKEHHIEELLANGGIRPMLNQIELHPLLSQEKLCAYCRAGNIAVQAWSPIMRGRVTEVPLLSELGRKYGKEPAQVALRWHLPREVLPLPKSVSPARIRSNKEIFDFSLTPEDMAAISALNRDQRIGPDPDKVDF